jgi:hypothetical protein
MKESVNGKMNQKVLFGDFFSSGGIIYRIFTNYHPKKHLVGQPQYSITKDKNMTSSAP